MPRATAGAGVPGMRFPQAGPNSVRCGKWSSNTEVQTVIPRGGGQAGDRWGGNTEAEVGLGDDVVILGQNSGFMGACSIFQ